MQKGFVPLVFILIISVLSVGIVGGVWYYKSLTNIDLTHPPEVKRQNNDSVVVNETDNWKVYKSQEYNFEIKYPPTVNIKEEEIVDPGQIYNKSHVYFEIDGGRLEIYGVCGRGIQPIKNKEITIADQKTIKFYETEDKGAIKAINRPNSDESICFGFTLPSNPKKTEEVDKLFDQMLSTFKFLEGKTVSWEEAVRILNSGQVTGTFQTHALDVILYLKDGSETKTKEPRIDEIHREIEKCSVCKKGEFMISTE
ncbi:hypothetical protein HYT74_04000 [Candidatus Daviesbacteria bacterium]|nr:hypothetical protein [Candidatus Daviesbacteria bacterium]MBI4038819.1 hypothetical protein [Candidatus Daviesbacteria bacterium]